jgi:hypothetical protein
MISFDLFERNSTSSFQVRRSLFSQFGGSYSMERYPALYTRRLTQKAKNFIDGFIEISPSSDGVQTRVKLLDEDDGILFSVMQPTRPPTDGTNFVLNGFLIQIDSTLPLSPSVPSAPPPPPPSTVRSRPAFHSSHPVKPANVAPPRVVVQRENPRSFEEIMAFFGDTDDRGTHDSSTILSNLAQLLD